MTTGRVRLRLKSRLAFRLNFRRTFFVAPGATEYFTRPSTTRVAFAAAVAPGREATRKPPQAPVSPVGHLTWTNTPSPLLGGNGEGTPVNETPPPPQLLSHGPGLKTGGGVTGGGLTGVQLWWLPGSEGWQSCVSSP